MIARLLRLYRLLRQERVALRERPIAAIASDQPAPGDAVRWLGPIDVAGDARHALFCHPTSSVSYVIHARPGDAVQAGCTLLPDVWTKNSGGCQFTMSVTVPGGASTSAALVADPGGRHGHRHWRTLRLAIPIDREAAVTIVLGTRVAPGARADYAWAIWGDPVVERPRPSSEVTSAMRTALGTAARHGPQVAVRELRTSAGLDERTSAYRRWAGAHALDAATLAAMTADAAALPYRPLVSIITPVYNTEPRWLRACIDSVRAQVYPNWELCLADDASPSDETRAVMREQTDPRIKSTFLEKNAGISGASNAALALARGEFIALLDHDDELTPDALYQMVRHLNDARDTDVIYSDEDKREEDGGLSSPFFKPCWSPEHLLSAMYPCHLTVARKSLVDRAGGFRAGYEGAQDHDLFLRLTEATTRIDHLPKVLYHWRRTPQSTASAGSAKPWADDAGRRALQDALRRQRIVGEVVSGGVPGLYRVKFAIVGEPSVEVVVVDARGAISDARGFEARGARIGVVHVTADEALLTREINAAVRASRAGHVAIVDAGLRPLDEDWLTAMLEYSQQAAIGAVGAKIQYADGRLRHIGMVTCLDGGPAAPFDGHPPDHLGYFSSAIGVRNYAAVSGECLMTRREVFDRLGGFDERLPWLGADVDYCARARGLGLRVVFTPYARLQYTGAPPLRPRGDAPDDPYFNPNLARSAADYLLR